MYVCLPWIQRLRIRQVHCYLRMQISYMRMHTLHMYIHTYIRTHTPQALQRQTKSQRSLFFAYCGYARFSAAVGIYTYTWAYIYRQTYRHKHTPNLRRDRLLLFLEHLSQIYIYTYIHKHACTHLKFPRGRLRLFSEI
jgi:hypothetical protein